MLISLAMTLSLAVAPQAQSATVPRIPARFENNYERTVFIEAQRDWNEARRQAVIDHRSNLADQLDRLIGSGDCPRAKEVALRYGYADIMEQVDIACTNRGLAPDRDARSN